MLGYGYEDIPTGTESVEIGSSYLRELCNGLRRGVSVVSTLYVAGTAATTTVCTIAPPLRRRDTRTLAVCLAPATVALDGSE